MRSFLPTDPPTPEIYTLSLHDALPILTLTTVLYLSCALISGHLAMMLMELTKRHSQMPRDRSEERFSRNAETDLVCRLLLEKKKRQSHGCCRGRPRPYPDNGHEYAPRPPSCRRV